MMPSTPVPVLRVPRSVHARPLPDGVHVQGRHAAFTAAGGPDVWRLWQRLEPHLRHGVGPAALDPVGAPAATRRAVRDLVQALRDHDMIVGGDVHWWAPAERPPGDVVEWLEDAGTTDPAGAWHRLTTTPATVAGPEPLAETAASALAAAGMRAERVPGPADGPLLRLRTGDGVSVLAAAGRACGFVTPPGPDRAAASLAARVAARLGEPATGPAPRLLIATLGAAAAHRLACGVAGIAEPAAPRGPARRPRDGWPLLLLGRADPWAVGYRPWPVPLDRARPDGALPAVTERFDALCDPDLGALPVPDDAPWPQVPAGLAVTSAGRDQPVLGTGPTTAAAREDSVLRAAERRLDPAMTGRLAVGTDRVHADGVLLRRAVLELLEPLDAGAGDPWSATDPVARRWWTALTRRFGVVARCRVVRLADGAVAVLVHPAGHPPVAALEATADDAAAFALMQAVALEQARHVGLLPDGGPATLCGAGDAAPTGAPPTGAGRVWDWPAARPAEPSFQAVLRGMLPAHRHPRDAAPRPGHLGDLLGAVGFAVREVS